VSMFVSGDVDENLVIALGGGVVSSESAYRTVRVPAVALGRFLESQGLQSAQLAQRVEPQTIASVPATGANSYWTVSPTGTFTGSTGKGVIVGIIDTGIDFRHKDFKKADGTTRILNIWDQSKNSTPPTGFTYGTEWTSAQINAGTCTQTDGNGHGTFIAGVAAGNGRGTIPALAAFRYVGMAPEADLIVVNAIMYDTYFADGVKYVFQKAQALGKPAVCLIASGRRTGPHDGTDPSEIMISSLVTTNGPNRLVVNAMGNYGASNLHARATPRTGTPGVVTLTLPTFNQTGDLSMDIDSWYESSNNFSITIKTPSGATVGPVTLGNYLNAETANAGFYISNGRTSNSQGDRQLTIIIRKSATSAALSAGVYTITATSVSGTGDIDFWAGDYFLNGGVPAFTGGVDPDRTAITPATADSAISVGAYTFRTTWIGANGTTYGLSGAPVINAIASFSGRGYRRDSRLMPDITAPGQAIGSSRSAWGSVSGTLILPDSVHMIRTGTSVAAAHVAGAMALELQVHKTANRNLSVQMAKLILASRSLKDSFTGTTPNSIWGNGKLKLTTSGAVGVDDAIFAAFHFAAPFPNPSIASTTFEFSIRAEDLGDAGRRTEVQLIDASGRRVRTLPGIAKVGPQRIAWDGRDDGGVLAPAGVYFAKLMVGDRSDSRKFVRISH
ncbi:MAG: S8 family serine peptidase, partial [Actinomycetes bacterium]